MNELMVDITRMPGGKNDNLFGTNIYVRAHLPNGRVKSVDIMVLTKKSLLDWLKMDGGDNRLAENTIGIMFEHGNLH